MVVGKRGEISISFEMIFSILIIVAIIGAASYALVYFLDFKKCSEIGLFYQDFQRSVDSAWNSDIVKNSFSGTLPTSIQEVCIGNLSQASQTTPQYKALRNYVIENANLFLYPPKESCDSTYKKLEHAKIEGFKCVQVRGGRVSFNLEKNEDEALVRVS